MKQELFQKITIPEGVEVKLEDSKLGVKGSEGENVRDFALGKIELKIEGNEIVIGHKKATKNEKKLINTFAAHIKNMVKGVQEKFEYKLKVCGSHFPITLEVNGNEATIKNFLGEKTPRKVNLPEGIEVQIDKDIVTIKSTDIEKAGQASANLEKSTKVGKRDRRIFQDGIYITSKCGEAI